MSEARKREKIPPTWAIAAADKYQVSLDWLIFGRGLMRPNSASHSFLRESDSELISVPLVEARLSAGGGSFETSGDQDSRYSFQRDFLQRKGQPGQMVLMRVTGDSMEPEIKSDDTVLVDQSQTKLKPGLLYAVGVEDLIYLKTINTKPGKLVLSSYNPAYSPIEVDMRGDLAATVRIIGRVVWLGRASS